MLNYDICGCTFGNQILQELLRAAGEQCVNFVFLGVASVDALLWEAQTPACGLLKKALLLCSCRCPVCTFNNELPTRPIVNVNIICFACGSTNNFIKADVRRQCSAGKTTSSLNIRGESCWGQVKGWRGYGKRGSNKNWKERGLHLPSTNAVALFRLLSL